MTGDALSRAARDAGPRIVAALAARFRDLDLAEESFAEACARAAETWPRDGEPRDSAAWLYRTAGNCGLDAVRRRRTRERYAPGAIGTEKSAEDEAMSDEAMIPDERLRLIFVCCHPAVSAESRAALTLRLVCGLSTVEIARAFLVPEATLAQRLVRAKRKISEAGISFDLPEKRAWTERIDSVLSTLEVAYSKAHEDAAGTSEHAGYAPQMLELTHALVDLLPHEPGTLALAATVRFAEARRPARLDADGAMRPLSEQDPRLWRRPLIDAGESFLRRAAEIDAFAPRVLQAAIHAAWCARRSLEDPPPWTTVLSIYDFLLEQRDDPVVRLNRAVAVAEVRGPQTALSEVDALAAPGLTMFLPYHAVRADLLRRLGRDDEARAAYDAALALGPAPAERSWLERRRPG